jgi:hypothetical protein
MDDFDHILNWKLKAGSHPFPGPDGGTCINEAALVACGFEYRAVSTVHSMPGCFSRPICTLAMQLNDAASDAERQRLMPFVTRLACADTREVERQRAALIDSHIKQHGPIRSGARFDKGLETLEAALAIGRQAEPPLFAEVTSRIEAARGRSKAPALNWERGLSSKLKSWLRASKRAQPVG